MTRNPPTKIGATVYVTPYRDSIVPEPGSHMGLLGESARQMGLDNSPKTATKKVSLYWKNEKRSIRLAMECAGQAKDRIQQRLFQVAVQGCFVVAETPGTNEAAYRCAFELKPKSILLWTTGKIFEVPAVLPDWVKDQPELMQIVEDGLAMRRAAGLPDDRAIPKRPIRIGGVFLCPVHETVPMIPDKDGRTIRCRAPGCEMKLVRKKIIDEEENYGEESQ